MAKWITFEQQPMGDKKTKTFYVYNKESHTLLGTVSWYGAFRQYSFTSYGKIIYEKQCLRDIADFLDNLMLERKVEKQNNKTQQV